MACCRALALQLLPASAHSRARISFHRRIRCCAAAGDQVEAPQDAVLKAISHDTTDEWLVLDKKVNTYPTVRGFTAIGTGGDDFVQSMVVAVESVIEERIPEGQISQKVSAKGKYVSVKIGPIRGFQGAGPSGVQCHEER
ncbi:unnamed protein product [Miscanthus lutarioriparius]|uniref:Uncharacterized protein n=1 Tax=Miscanthus lutarioriparius TaxID=422564 RepID=A0A811PFY7_9POAL|nr:unnamed protein product [Miscanthus lutarioriparius]